jgi:capsular polysaccharide biosynthesis protein
LKIITQIEDLGATFSNASLVLGSSLIFDPTLSTAWTLNPFDPATDLLQEEVTRRIQRFTVEGEDSYAFASQPQNCGTLTLPLFALSTLHPYNYFHFLIESLPDFFYLKQNKFIDESYVIVTGHLHRNFRDALNIAMGNSVHPILELKLMQKIDAPVVLAGCGALHGTEKKDGTLSLFNFKHERLQFFRNAFKNYWASSSETRLKIYVSRKSYQRNLVNNEELEERARKAGFIVVNPEQFSFFEQIHLFSRAGRIIGSTGAWLANLAFVPETTKVSVLYPETCKTESSLWYELGRIFGVEVEDVYCPIAKHNDYQPIHSDYLCPQEIAQALIDV